jgi:hypothetical protein
MEQAEQMTRGQHDWWTIIAGCVIVLALAIAVMMVVV